MTCARTDAKLVLEQLLTHPIMDAKYQTIQWTPAQRKWIRQAIDNLEFDLRTDSLTPLNEPEEYTNG